jgi:hypothetical protein
LRPFRSGWWRLQERDSLYHLFEKVHFGTRWLMKLLPYLTAFLFGIVINEVSDPRSRSPGDVLRSMYDVDQRPLAWINIAVTVLLVSVPLAYVSLRAVIGRTTQAVRLTRKLQSYISPTLRAMCRGRIAWGEEIVLQSCPKINEGWRLEDVRIVLDPTAFQFRSFDDASAFSRWNATTTDDRIRRGNKYRLLENPVSFTDDPSLTLRVQETKYAQAVFVNRNLVFRA